MFYWTVFSAINTCRLDDQLIILYAYTQTLTNVMLEQINVTRMPSVMTMREAMFVHVNPVTKEMDSLVQVSFRIHACTHAL